MERKYRRQQFVEISQQNKSSSAKDLYEVDGSSGWETCSLFELINDNQIGKIVENYLSFPESNDWCVVTCYRGFDRMNKAHIRIPDTINGKLVVGIGRSKPITPILYGRFDNENGEFTPLYNVVSIHIPDFVRFVLDDFVCPNLKEINIPHSLEFVGSYSYCGYKNPTVTIPGSVHMISDRAFTNSSLRNIVIDEGVRQIHEEAFGDSLHISTVTLPKSIEFIDATAFTHWRTCYGEYISYASYSRLHLTNRSALQGTFRFCDAVFFVPPDSYALKFVKAMGYTYEII